MPPESGSVISVEIHGQRYPIRSSLDSEYVARLAMYVDEKYVREKCGHARRVKMLAAGQSGWWMDFLPVRQQGCSARMELRRFDRCLIGGELRHDLRRTS